MNHKEKSRRAKKYQRSGAELLLQKIRPEVKDHSPTEEKMDYSKSKTENRTRESSTKETALVKLQSCDFSTGHFTF